MVNKKAAVILVSSFFAIVTLLLLSMYFTYDARSQLKESILAQESLIKANNLQEEERVDLQNKLDRAEYVISDTRLELDALLKKPFPDLEEESLDPWETFWGFAWAVNTREYDVAYSLTNYSYQSTCSPEDFTIAVKSSGIKFPSMKLLGLAAEPNLKVAMVFYTILPPNPDSGLLKTKMIPEEGGHFVFPVVSSFCGDLSLQGPSPPITVFQ